MWNLYNGSDPTQYVAPGPAVWADAKGGSIALVGIREGMDFLVPPPADFTLRDLYERRRWFDLRDAVTERWLARVAVPLAAITAAEGPAPERLHQWFSELVATKQRWAAEDPALFATYLAIAAFVFLLAVVFYFAPIPEVTDADMEFQASQSAELTGFEDKPIWKQTKLLLAVMAQFCYVGAQVSVASQFIKYAQTVAGLSSSTASNRYAVAQAVFRGFPAGAWLPPVAPAFEARVSPPVAWRAIVDRYSKLAWS